MLTSSGLAESQFQEARLQMLERRAAYGNKSWWLIRTGAIAGGSASTDLSV